nr:HupE/UreJ family protein [Psychrobacter sp. JCM 18901]
MTQCTKGLHIESSRFSQVLSAPHIVSGSAVMTSLMLPSLAQAHSGHIHSTTAQAPSFLGTLQAGLMHPVTGLDHLFLAVGMGMLFYGLQKQRLGMMSLTAGLSLGAILGTAGVLIGGIAFVASSGLIEVAISLSVVVLAIVLMSQKKQTRSILCSDPYSTHAKYSAAIIVWFWWFGRLSWVGTCAGSTSKCWREWSARILCRDASDDAGAICHWYVGQSTATATPR